MQLKPEEIFRKQLAEGDEVVEKMKWSKTELRTFGAEESYPTRYSPDILDNSHHSARSNWIYNPEGDQIREGWLEVYFFCSFFIGSSFMRGRNYFPKLLVPDVLELQFSHKALSMDIDRRRQVGKDELLCLYSWWSFFHVVNFLN